MGSFNPRINKGYNPITKNIENDSTESVTFFNMTATYYSERVQGIVSAEMTPKQVYDTYYSDPTKDFIVFAKVALYDPNQEKIVAYKIEPTNIIDGSVTIELDYDGIYGATTDSTWAYSANPKDTVKTMTFRNISFDANGNTSLTNVPDNIVPLYYKIDDTDVIVSFFESSIDNNLGIHAIDNNGNPYTETDTRGVLFYIDRN